MRDVILVRFLVYNRGREVSFLFNCTSTHSDAAFFSLLILTLLWPTNDFTDKEVSERETVTQRQLRLLVGPNIRASCSNTHNLLSCFATDVFSWHLLISAAQPLGQSTKQRTAERAQSARPARVSLSVGRIARTIRLTTTLCGRLILTLRNSIESMLAEIYTFTCILKL